MSKIEAVLFDMDGVLIDSEPVHFQMMVETLDAHGLPTPNDAEWEEFLVGRPDRDGLTDWLLGHRIDADIGALMADKLERMTACFEELVAPCDDGQWLARELARRGMPLAVVTGARRAELDIVLKRFDLGNVFAATISADDVRTGKPEPEPFLAGAAALGVSATACAVIEDAVPGLRAAEAAGMRPFVVDRGGDPARFVTVTPFSALDSRVLTVLLELAGIGSARHERDGLDLQR